jgi:hypothetical protein
MKRIVAMGFAVLSAIVVLGGVLLALGQSSLGWGILLGGGLAWFFFATTAITALRTAATAPHLLGFIVLGSWLVKIIVLLCILGWLRGQDFYSRPAFFATLLLATFATLAFEALITLKTRVPYVDPQ